MNNHKRALKIAQENIIFMNILRPCTEYYVNLFDFKEVFEAYPDLTTQLADLTAAADGMAEALSSYREKAFVSAKLQGMDDEWATRTCAKADIALAAYRKLKERQRNEATI